MAGCANPVARNDFGLPTMTATILILNGPNLNLVGVRETGIYGDETIEDIAAAIEARATELAVSIDIRQSNSEGELVGWIQSARDGADGIIINAGAYSHTSIAILDALRACGVPVIEVHLSNIFSREPYRHHSYVSEAARGIICGFGGAGYTMALEAMMRVTRS
jgi:3-dehydroquinate dehydratase-2